MTDIELGLPDAGSTKSFFKDPRNLVYTIAVPAVAWIGLSLANEAAIGDKDQLLCNKVRAEFSQAVNAIPTTLPPGNERDVSISMSVTLPAEEIGSFIPWSNRECIIL